MMIAEETPEQRITRHYAAMLDSVAYIHGVIDGIIEATASPIAKRDAVRRNVEHLELMLDRPFWTTEDMAPIQSAIEAGHAHLNPAPND